MCEEDPEAQDTIQFTKADVPAPLIPHSYASESAAAWVMYQKYVNALPLYRQEQDWKQLGVLLSRATMANWIIYSATNYLRPLYDYLHAELRKRQFLMADETRVQVLKEKERAAETNSFMWLFRSGDDGLPAIILFHYAETKAKYHAEEFLKGFTGYLETDGYQGYHALPGVKRCCCWAHARRYFIDAVPRGKAFDLSEPAVQGVKYCDKLFDYERRSKEKKHTYEERKAYRLEKEMPVLEAFWKWISEQHPKKGTRFEKALNYVQNQKDLLMTYLEDGRCSLSNNMSEGSIRPFTVGRKNWVFCDTPKGAESSAIVYSLVSMAKAHDLNVYQYLQYLLEHRPYEGMPEAQLAKLTPWAEEVIASCARTK